MRLFVALMLVACHPPTTDGAPQPDTADSADTAPTLQPAVAIECRETDEVAVITLTDAADVTVWLTDAVAHGSDGWWWIEDHPVAGSVLELETSAGGGVAMGVSTVWPCSRFRAEKQELSASFMLDGVCYGTGPAVGWCPR